MQMFIYFKSLGRYLAQSKEHIREQLFSELRERLHQKDYGSIPHDFSEEPESINRLARLIVRDPDAPAAVLNRLASCDDEEILERIAEHPRVSAYTLTELARSEYASVRMAVAENANTPINVLNELAIDDHPDVRYRLAESPHVCVSILLSLETDDNPFVSLRASMTLERLNFGYRSVHAA